MAIKVKLYISFGWGCHLVCFSKADKKLALPKA